MTVRRIQQARKLRMFPPSRAWMGAQPAGWVAEILAAWQADEAREAWLINHKPTS